MLLLVVISAGAFADEQFNVRIESQVGFGGLFKPGRWTPVQLTVQNLGPDVFGSLVVKLDRRNRFGPDRRVNLFTRDLDLASGSVKTFAFVLPLETGVYPLEVTLRNDDTEVVTREVKLAGRGASGALVAVLSRRTSLDFLLPVFNSGGERALDVVYPLVDYLPSRWHGYDGLDLLVVHDGRLQDLTESQISAIRQWISAGGRLVVSAGAHLGPTDREVVGLLTGREPEGVAVSVVSGVGLEAAGLPVVGTEADQPVVVSRFGESDAVVQVQRHGRGQIVVLPFDYAQFVRVAPATSLGLWLSLLPEEAVLESARQRDGIVPISVSRRVFETDLLANQLGLPLYEFPSRLLVTGLTGSFVAAVVALLVWMGRRKRAYRAGLAAILIVVVAATTAALGHMTLTVRLQPAQALAFSLELAEMGPEDGYAISTKDVLLFSRQRADFSIWFPHDAVIVPLSHHDHSVTLDRGGDVLNLAASRWTHVNSHAMQVIEVPVRTRIQRGPGYASIELSNESVMTLDGLVVLNNGFPALIGRVMPGETVEHVVMGTGVGRWDQIEWVDLVPPGGLSRHRAQLLRDLARAHREEETEGLVLVAWTAESMINNEISPDFEHTVNLNALVIRESIQSRDDT